MAATAKPAAQGPAIKIASGVVTDEATDMKTGAQRLRR